MKDEYQQFINDASTNAFEIKKSFKNFKKRKPKNLDQLFHEEHQKVFQKLDCLACANCCKTTSPIFRDVDIKRISKSLRQKEADFIKIYLRMDEDADYVLQKSPCSFLNTDNKCSIYEIRPLACREYPHTDRKNMVQILELTEKNTLICPAVAKITLEILKNE